MNSAILLAACVLYCAAAHAAPSAAAHRARRDLVAPECPEGMVRHMGLCLYAQHPDISDKQRMRRYVPFHKSMSCPPGYTKLHNGECVRLMPSLPSPMYPEDDDEYNI